MRADVTASQMSCAFGVSVRSRLREPRMQAKLDLRRQNDMAHRSHPITVQLGSFRRSLSRLVSLFRQAFASSYKHIWQWHGTFEDCQSVQTLGLGSVFDLYCPAGAVPWPGMHGHCLAT